MFSSTMKVATMTALIAAANAGGMGSKGGMNSPPPPPPAPTVPPEPLTTVYLRGPAGVDFTAPFGDPVQRWKYAGSGPAWVTFNGGVEGLRFNVNQMFSIKVCNEVEDTDANASNPAERFPDSSLHVHGLTPPYRLDGVPYLQSCPIPFGQCVNIEYPLAFENIGSYWAHSHVGFQHEHGLAFPVVIDGPMPKNYPNAKEIDTLADAVMFLEEYCPYGKDDDLTNQSANPSCRSPKDVYDLLKDVWAGERPNYDWDECKDLAKPGGWDVGYHYHLANHKQAVEPAVATVPLATPASGNRGMSASSGNSATAGKTDTTKLRLRIISGSDMSNFRIDLGDLEATLIATDGQPVVPMDVSMNSGNPLWVAVGQRMDIVVEVPNTEVKAFPIFAVLEHDGHPNCREDDFCGETAKCSVADVDAGDVASFNGTGGVCGSTYDILMNDLFPNTPELCCDVHVRQAVMVISVGGAPAGTYSKVPTRQVGMLRGAHQLTHHAWTNLAKVNQADVVNFFISATGDNGFDSINLTSWTVPPINPVFNPNPNPLVVETGNRVCITIENRNKESHPFHLHGHSFQITKIGNEVFHGAMRDVVVVDAGRCKATEICFNANNAGVWPLHCHMTYHLAAGMMTSVEYKNIGESFMCTTGVGADGLLGSGSSTSFMYKNGFSAPEFSPADWQLPGASNDIGNNQCGCTPGWSYAPPVSSTNSKSVGGVAAVGGSSATGTASTVGAVVAVAVVVVAVAVIISKRRTRAAKMSQSAAISDQMEWSGGDGLPAMTKSLEVSEDVSV